MTPTPAPETILSIRGLSKTFQTANGVVHALDNISFDVARGSVVGLVGESGSGKTTLGRCVLRLASPSSGQVIYDGQDLLALDHGAMRAMRKKMQIIFQDPYSSLNPRMRVRDIIGEALHAHGMGMTQNARTDLVATLLEEVGLQPDQMFRYPHEFSGGQRQRIGIARALSVEPEFIVADEAVSALDVSVQAQILNLIQDLKERRNLTLLFIAHDLSVVEYLCDEIVVLYLGQVVEKGPSDKVYGQPMHPYTQALLSAIPVPYPGATINRQTLQGDIPNPLEPPSGCVFRTRCRLALDACSKARPQNTQVDLRHEVACIRIGTTPQ